MVLSDIPRPDLAERLRRPGVLLRTGPLVWRLGTTLPELVDPIRVLYADFAVDEEEEEGIVDFSVRVERAPLPGRILGRAVTSIDGQRAFTPFVRRLALPMLEWSINWCVFTRPNQYLLLHAAVLERSGWGLLLSGKPGAGKSTLCAGLILRGWRLLSDEVAMIPPGKRRLVPAPRPVGLKGRSIEIVRGFDGDAVIGPSCPGTRKGTVAHLRPPRDSVRRAEEEAVPAWIVFPRFASGAPAELTRLPRPEALLRVAQEGFNYSLLGAVGFETLAEVVGRCDCYEFRYGRLDEAIEVFHDLASRRPEAALLASRPSPR